MLDRLKYLEHGERSAAWLRAGNFQSGKARPSRAGRAGTARAPISRSSRPTPPRSRSAFSTAPARRRSRGSSCRNIPTRSSTGTCPRSGPAPSMATASTGPTSPNTGHRFNPNKLLLDPYARAHVGELKWDPAVFGYQMEAMDDLTFDERDSAPFMPKCVVVDPEFRLARRAQPPARPLGPHHPLRDPRQAASPSSIRRCRRRCAAPMPASAPVR